VTKSINQCGDQPKPNTWKGRTSRVQKISPTPPCKASWEYYYGDLQVPHDNETTHMHRRQPQEYYIACTYNVLPQACAPPYSDVNLLSVSRHAWGKPGGLHKLPSLAALCSIWSPCATTRQMKTASDRVTADAAMVRGRGDNPATCTRANYRNDRTAAIKYLKKNACFPRARANTTPNTCCPTVKK